MAAGASQQIFAKGNREIIGIIVPDFFYQFYSHFLNHVLNTYDQYGYKFITFLGNNDCEAEKKYLSELLAYQIIGLIDLSHNLSSEYLSKLDIPVVTIRTLLRTYPGLHRYLFRE